MDLRPPGFAARAEFVIRRSRACERDRGRDSLSAGAGRNGVAPGLEGLWGVLHRCGAPDEVFFFEGSLRIVRLSPNWAVPIPLPGESAFLTLTYNRYVPIPGSRMTANCSYLERWGTDLEPVRFARAKSAAICYGASVYRLGREPATINIRRDAE